MRISYFYDLPVPSRYAAMIQIVHTCRALAELGVPVTLYCGPLAGDSVAEALAFYGLEPHPNLRLEPLYGGRWQRFTFVRRLRHALSEPSESRHFLISRGESGIEFFRHWHRAARRPHHRFVYEAHRLCYPAARRWATTLVRRRERAAVAGADGLLYLTAGVKAALEREFTLTASGCILPSGTVVPSARPDREPDLDIIYTGKLVRRKGVYDLVEAMRYLSEYRLWIVGGTAEEVATLREWAVSQGVEERVVLTGFVEPAKMAEFYRRARVGTCPLPVGESQVTEQYTSPLKILDMMAHGVPVVATDLPTVSAILRHEQSALLVPPSDPQALAAGIRRLLEDRGLAHRLAAAGRAEVMRYSWEQRATHLLGFLTSLL